MTDSQIIINKLNSREFRNIFDELWILHLYLVGSYSRSENTKDSDIDLVYEKNSKIRVWWIKFINSKNLLEEKLWKKIDLVNNLYIYSDLKSSIEKDKILIY